jgi:beta-lactamase regulating signal transducer with metallopeptidase domain
MIYGLLASYGLKVLLLSIVALVALLVIGRTSAAKRNVMAVASLLALLILPWMSAHAPRQEIPASAAVARPIAYAVMPTLAATDLTTATHAGPIVAEQVAVAANYGSIALVIAYFVIAGLLVLRLILGFIKVWSWTRDSSALLGNNVRTTEKARVPMTVWAGRSVILLPEEAKEWDQQRLAHVLGHERAHVQRRDLLWNVLGQLACAIYWPLPTVWALQRISRATSERSCDDMVLGSGIAPSEYANDLLTIARDLSRSWPAPALPMANKSEVESRIEHILSSRVRRGSAGLVALIATTTGSLVLSLPLAIIGLQGVPEGGQTPPTKTGWASPGSWSATPENGYVGTLPDGRKVQLLQVQRYNGQGFEAWKLDGTMIASPTIYGRTYWMTKPNRLVLVTRFQSSVTDDSITAGMGTGPAIEGEPPEQSFAGNGVLKASESGWRTAVSFNEIPIGNMTRSSYTFSLSDTAYVVIGTVKLNPDGSIAVDTKTLKDVSFISDAAVKVPIPNPKGGWMGKEGHELTRTAHGCSVKFTTAGGMVGDLKVTVFDKQGKAHESIWNDGGYVNGLVSNGLMETHYFEVPASQVDRIEIATRKDQAVELLDVKLQPKPIPPP